MRMRNHNHALNADLGDGLLAAELLHQLEGQLTLSAIRQLYNLHQ
jgi:hypothetical protein